jgi:hypothetical protein
LNARKKLPEEYESLGVWKKYYLLYEARNLNFKQLFDLETVLYPELSVERRFKACLRLKKGIVYHSQRNK